MTIIEKNEPVKIFISARYVGYCLRRARIENKISRKETAKKLNLTNRQLLYTECDRLVISKQTLIKLLRIGIGHYN